MSKLGKFLMGKRLEMKLSRKQIIEMMPEQVRIDVSTYANIEKGNIKKPPEKRLVAFADITGFPEDYRWYGSNKLKTWMIGNAVPILLAKVIIHETKKNYDARRCKDTLGRDPENSGKATNWREEKSDELRLFNQPEGFH